MTKLIYKSKNQQSRPVVNYYDFSHATINIGSNNLISDNVEVKETQSSEQGSAEDKRQSYDWRKACEIIVVVLKVLAQLLIITPPLFNLLC